MVSLRLVMFCFGDGNCVNVCVLVSNHSLGRAGGAITHMMQTVVTPLVSCRQADVDVRGHVGHLRA